MSVLADRDVCFDDAEVPDGRSLTEPGRRVSERSANHSRRLCDVPTRIQTVLMWQTHPSAAQRIKAILSECARVCVRVCARVCQQGPDALYVIKKQRSMNPDRQR